MEPKADSAAPSIALPEVDRRKGADVISVPDINASQASSRRDEQCKKLFDDDQADCSQVSKEYGPKAWRICYSTAMERYGECLHRGIEGVRTPLMTYFEE